MTYFFCNDFNRLFFYDFKLHLRALIYVLNKNLTPYIYILFFCCFNQQVYSQNFELIVKGKDSIETAIIKEIPYIKKHLKKSLVYEEINQIQVTLKKLGFFISTIDSIQLNKRKFNVNLNLGLKTEDIIVLRPKKNQIENHFVTYDSIRLKTKDFEEFTTRILKEQDTQGKSFTEITFKNPTYKKNILFLELSISESTKRFLNKIIIKGYEDFPKKFIKHYFKIDNKTLLSKEKIEKISILIKKLNFINEKKKPQVLFKKDSTHLYLYINKFESSSFDGILNFASKENGNGILLNGNLNLNLVNVFNSGEQFGLFWNKVGEEKSEFKIFIDKPFILNSPISTKMSFNLFRQDSTFLNTNINIDTKINLNNSSQLSILFSGENSNYLLNEYQSNIESYSNYFTGIGYQHTVASKNALFNDTFNFDIRSTIGKRKSLTQKTNQIKVEASTSFNIKVNSRSYVYTKNGSGLLNSNNYFTNELFRIGGVNSIRGFNEQSIFTNQYSYFNIEYRYQTSQDSYLYSLTDIGIYNGIVSKKLQRLIGIGLGYNFKLNNGYFNFAYAIGSNSNSNNSTIVKNSKIIIKWTSFF